MKCNINIPNWDELNKIFENGYKGANSKVLKRLEALGYETDRSGTHPKMYIVLNGTKHCVTLCSTASDCYAGRQTLRYIRAIYERGGYRL